MGAVPYSIALELQHDLSDKIEADLHPTTILGVEHPSVITLGKRANPEEEIKVSLDSLDDLNVQCYKVDRGGHATLHSPGQLVIYPILKLSNYNLSVRDYLCVLQKTTIEFFNQLGIKTFAREDSPGIYTKNGKIAFFGIRVKKGVAFHGLAINISNEIEDFSLIRSCGINAEKFDKVQNYGVNQSLESFFHQWIEIWNQKCRL